MKFTGRLAITVMVFYHFKVGIHEYYVDFFIVEYGMHTNKKYAEIYTGKTWRNANDLCIE